MSLRLAHCTAGLALAACCAAAAHEAPLALQLDKPAQHRAGIRTVQAQTAVELLRLPARVVADPRRELRVAAPQDGVVEAAGQGLPLPGQKVRAGQVLAQLRPMLSQPERRDLDVDLNNAERDLKLDRLQIDRYGIDENEKLEVKLPTPSIEIITGYRSATARKGELQTALQKPVPLLAPRGGVVLRSPALAGRVAVAGQTLFELVADAPAASGLAVEAEYGDEQVDAEAATQALSTGGDKLALQFLGESYDSGLRSHRALYALTGDASLSANEPVLLLAPRGEAQVRLPAAAVFHHAGQDWVWLHAQAQGFVAQPVTLAANDGETASIASGLSDGERVVVVGMDALNAAAARGEAR